jgi:hypothetical protein
MVESSATEFFSPAALNTILPDNAFVTTLNASVLKHEDGLALQEHTKDLAVVRKGVPCDEIDFSDPKLFSCLYWVKLKSSADTTEQYLIAKSKVGYRTVSCLNALQAWKAFIGITDWSVDQQARYFIDHIINVENLVVSTGLPVLPMNVIVFWYRDLFTRYLKEKDTQLSVVEMQQESIQTAPKNPKKRPREPKAVPAGRKKKTTAREDTMTTLQNSKGHISACVSTATTCSQGTNTAEYDIFDVINPSCFIPTDGTNWPNKQWIESLCRHDAEPIFLHRSIPKAFYTGICNFLKDHTGEEVSHAVASYLDLSNIEMGASNDVKIALDTITKSGTHRQRNGLTFQLLELLRKYK